MPPKKKTPPKPRKKVNSKQKGSRGEREFRDLLRSFGLHAYRSQQYSGVGESSADVICPNVPQVHFEVKRTEAFLPYKYMDQAIHDAKGKMPVVAYKRSGEQWLAVLPAEIFIALLLTSKLHPNLELNNNPNLEGYEEETAED